MAMIAITTSNSINVNDLRKTGGGNSHLFVSCLLRLKTVNCLNYTKCFSENKPLVQKNYRFFKMHAITSCSSLLCKCSGKTPCNSKSLCRRSGNSCLFTFSSIFASLCQSLVFDALNVFHLILFASLACFFALRVCGMKNQRYFSAKLFQPETKGAKKNGQIDQAGIQGGF